jgi:hypothetical protein
LYAAKSLILFITVLVLLSCLVCAAYCFIRGRLLRGLSYAAPYLSILFIMACWSFAQTIVGKNFIGVIRLHLFSQSACIRSATTLGDGEAFAICVDHFDSLASTSNLIVYDSTGEVALRAGKQSDNWKKVVSRLKSPFGSEDMTFTARKIADHFYSVDFSLKRN